MIHFGGTAIKPTAANVSHTYYKCLWCFCNDYRAVVLLATLRV